MTSCHSYESPGRPAKFPAQRSLPRSGTAASVPARTGRRSRAEPSRAAAPRQAAAAMGTAPRPPGGSGAGTPARRRHGASPAGSQEQRGPALPSRESEPGPERRKAGAARERGRGGPCPTCCACRALLAPGGELAEDWARGKPCPRAGGHTAKQGAPSAAVGVSIVCNTSHEEWGGRNEGRGKRSLVNH